mmetsp:Transcript_18356/g.22876  ORF Transcript_18356/g.22876 Transcript_18356/m.22876 type:complete len:272 (+) Transcript_18356:1836-2651(+)
MEGSRSTLSGLLGVSLDELNDALDEGVLEAILDALGAPLVHSLLLDGTAATSLGLLELFSGFLSHGDEAVHVIVVVTLVPDDFFEDLAEGRLHFIINWQFTRINDTHVHAILNSVVEENRVEGLAQVVQATEREGQVRKAAGDVAVRALLAHLLCRQNEVFSVLVVLFHSRCYGENIKIEDDILGSEINRHQQIVGANADAHLFFKRGRLAGLVEGHHDDSSTVPLNQARLVQELFLAFLERDTVDDALALALLQACFDDVEFRRVYHNGN